MCYNVITVKKGGSSMVQGKEGSVTKTRLTVTVDIGINEQLEAYCKETLRNKSVVVNKAIQEYLERNDPNYSDDTQED